MTPTEILLAARCVQPGVDVPLIREVSGYSREQQATDLLDFIRQRQEALLPGRDAALLAQVVALQERLRQGQQVCLIMFETLEQVVRRLNKGIEDTAATPDHGCPWQQELEASYRLTVQLLNTMLQRTSQIVTDPSAGPWAPPAGQALDPSPGVPEPEIVDPRAPGAS